MKENKKEQSRREFIQQGAIVSVGLLITTTGMVGTYGAPDKTSPTGITIYYVILL